MHPFHKEQPASLWNLLQSILNDWVPFAPLSVCAVILLILFPFFSKSRKDAILLLGAFALPILGLYIFCTTFNVTHFVTSRYFINFLPLFFITLYLSIGNIESRLQSARRLLRIKPLFIILFIASNFVLLPFYYRAEKQDLRGLTNFLKVGLREGDHIFVGATGYVPGILHYLGAHPAGRHHVYPYVALTENRTEYRIDFSYRAKRFSINHSNACCAQYTKDGGRVWIVMTQSDAKMIDKDFPLVLKGYFDGSFLNFAKFPMDASIYLFLWDPNSPGEKGIEMPIE
jgi:hypothetical protein